MMYFMYYCRTHDPDRLFKDYSSGLIPFNLATWALYINGFQSRSSDGTWGYWVASSDRKNVFDPPTSSVSLYHPKEGFYSCKNKSLIRKQLSDLESAGISAIIVPWYSANKDEVYPGTNSHSDKALFRLLNIAEETTIKVGILIPRYNNRSWDTIIKDIASFTNIFGMKTSILKDQSRPVFLIQDAQHLDNTMESLSKIRRTYLDCFFIGCFNTLSEYTEGVQDGFDAVSTFYPTDEFTWASNTSNWKLLREEMKSRSVPFIASVSPGYDSTRSSFNKFSPVMRNGGKHYDERWQKAIAIGSNIVLVNSYNNWVENTGIEPVIETSNYGLTDTNWKGSDPNAFITATRKWTKRLMNVQESE